MGFTLLLASRWSVSRFLMLSAFYMVLSWMVGVLPVHGESIYPYVKTFKISAYYSPLPGQSSYATGSYEGDIRLNGNGTNGADGTPVYPGMIAAPSTYSFGTKMSIPGVGLVAVHDRGGAIVTAGDRGQLYDRLDIWMGYGDEGLRRALTWGVKYLDVTVYGIDDSLAEQVYLERFTYTESIVKNVVLAPQLFEQDLWYLSTTEDVGRLQQTLKDLGYYQGEITNTYDDLTREAVFQFQLAEGILNSWDDFGAGHTGVNTRKMLDYAVARMKEGKEQPSVSVETVSPESDEEFQRYQKGLLLLNQNPDLLYRTATFTRDLTLGSMGDDVRALQEELVQLGYLRIDPTGYYGELTQHAVFKLQQKWGLVGTKEDAGAGVFGPLTRSAMNKLIGERTTSLSYIAVNRDEQAESPDPVEVVPDAYPRTLIFGDRGEDVKNLQALLKRLGYFQGTFLTEFYGEQTKAAVSNFQLANGLIDSVDDASAGVVNESTRLLLNSLN